MDDMVIGKSLSEQDFKELFDSAYVNREYNLEIQKNFWRRLNDQPLKLGAIQSEVVKEWETLIEVLSPALVCIAQYEANTFRRAKFPIPDQIAFDVLQQLGQVL